jgi:hypothetical protein
VAQILYRDGSDAPATEVLTVADLLSRNARVPVKDDEPETGGISVGALLRREGRAPRAADRPLQPRPHQERADEEVGSGRRALVRRGGIAAGTLVAAGSVFGAALLTDVTPSANQAPGTGGAADNGAYPGQGLLDPEAPVVTPPDSVVIDQAAATDPLDPGTPAPSDWVTVAFPGAQAGTDGGDPGSGDPSGNSGDDDVPAAATTGADDNADSATDSGSSADNSGTNSSGGGSEDSGSSAGSGSGDSGGGSGDDDDRDEDGGLVSDVGETVGGVVDTVGGVLGLGGGDDDRNSESEESDGGDRDENSRSMRLSSADDEDSSAPQDEDDSESRSDAKSSDDSDDDEGGNDGDDDKGDGDGDGGLVGSLLGTVGGLLG